MRTDFLRQKNTTYQELVREKPSVFEEGGVLSFRLGLPSGTNGEA